MCCVRWKMQNIRETDSIYQCRLCDAVGQHDIDIWSGNQQTDQNNESDLSHKIFETLNVQVTDEIMRGIDVTLPFLKITLSSHSQVRRSDDSTKLCRGCFDNVNKYFHFRNICAARDEYHARERLGIMSLMRHHDFAALSGTSGQWNPIDGADSTRGRGMKREYSPNDQKTSITCITVTDSESEDEDGNVELPLHEKLAAHLSAKRKT